MGAMLATAYSASAVPIRGQVRLPPGPQQEPTPDADGPPDHYWRVWDGELDPARLRPNPRREAAVVLTGESSRPPIDCTYAVQGGDLMPRTFVARAGTRVAIENRDGTGYHLFAEGLDTFRPLRTAPGRSRELTMPDAGAWPIRDSRYAHVGGHLVTIPDLVACAHVDHRGNWVFPDVPAGDYTLKVFRAGAEAHAAPISVPSRGRGLTVDPILLTGN